MSNNQEKLVLVDVNGTSHNITKGNVINLVGFGWGFYSLSFVLNIIYYKIHPSFTDVSPTSILQRLKCRKNVEKCNCEM